MIADVSDAWCVFSNLGHGETQNSSFGSQAALHHDNIFNDPLNKKQCVLNIGQIAWRNIPVEWIIGQYKMKLTSENMWDIYFYLTQSCDSDINFRLQKYSICNECIT